MPELNRANRRCANIDIRDYETGKPILKLKKCNTTTVGFSSDNTFAMAMGAKAIAFANPIEGTMTMEMQVYPYKLFALFNDGEIKKGSVKRVSETVVAEEGSLTVKGTPKEGTFFAFKEGEWGGAEITGSLSGKKFTADSLHAGDVVEVGYLEVSETEGKTITIGNNALPKDVTIYQETIDKNEKGQDAPFAMFARKATIQRSLDLSFASEGEPMSITVTFDCLADDDNEVLDMYEL